MHIPIIALALIITPFIIAFRTADYFADKMNDYLMTR